jgi:hypothetical protein
MIPYDDLVAALSSWRARQGLPTGQLQASPSKPTAVPAAASAAASAARSSTKPGAAAPIAASGRVPVRAASEPAMDVDEDSFVEEGSFDRELDNAFGSDNLGEATAIGAAPTPTAPPRRR